MITHVQVYRRSIRRWLMRMLLGGQWLPSARWYRDHHRQREGRDHDHPKAYQVAHQGAHQEAHQEASRILQWLQVRYSRPGCLPFGLQPHLRRGHLQEGNDEARWLCPIRRQALLAIPPCWLLHALRQEQEHSHLGPRLLTAVVVVDQDA